MNIDNYILPDHAHSVFHYTDLNCHFLHCHTIKESKSFGRASTRNAFE